MEPPSPALGMGPPFLKSPPPALCLRLLKLPQVHAMLPNVTWQLLMPPPWREAVVLADVIQPDIPAMLYNGVA